MTNQRWLTVVALCSVLALGAPTQAQGPGATAADGRAALEAEVRAVHAAYLKTLTTDGVDAALERYKADEFTYVGLDGKIIDKAGIKARMKQNQLALYSLSDDLRRVSVYGNTAVLSGHATGSGTDKGKEQKIAEGYTEVWVKQDGKWQLVAEQITPQKR